MYSITSWAKEFMEADDSNEVSKQFMKHFVVCVETGISRIFYLKYDARNELVWTDTSTESVKNSFKSICIRKGKSKIHLFNEAYAIWVDHTAIDIGKDYIYSNENHIVFNRYIKPRWNINKITDWINSKDYNKATALEVNDWIDYHMKTVICNSNEADYNWLYNWISNALYNVNFTPLCAPILQSTLTGTGKSSFISKIFKEFMGPAYCIKDDSNFTTNGALSCMVGKTFCLIDELKIESKTDYNKLKTLISEPEISYEKKYVDTQTVANITKSIITTNHLKPITCIIPSDRRFVFFSLDAQKTVKEKYFDTLIDENWKYFSSYFISSCCKSKGFIKMKFSNYKTDFNKRTAEISLNPVGAFIKDVIISEYNKFDEFIQTTMLYEKFKEFYMQMYNIQTKMHIRSFQTSLIDNGVIIGAPVQKTIKIFNESIRTKCYTLKSRNDIIVAFMNSNSQLNPVDYETCSCGKARAVLFCKDCGNLCDICKIIHSSEHNTEQIL